MTRATGTIQTSNPWKLPASFFPILGIILFSLRATAQTADLAKATAWLDRRAPQIATNPAIPVRTLALAALALQNNSNAGILIAAIAARQNNNGCWREAGTADALADQSLATIATASHAPREKIILEIRTLLASQRDDGGWSESMGRYDHASPVSTALALLALDTAEKYLTPAGQKNPAGDEIQKARRHAYEFLQTIQDPATGEIGYEGRAYGSWGSTAAGIAALKLTGHAASRESRAAIIALTRNDVMLRTTRQPLIESWIASSTLSMCPAAIRDALHDALVNEISSHQQPDGSWPAPKRQRSEGDVYTTAAAIIAVRSIESETRDAKTAATIFVNAGLLITNGLPHHAKILISFPADKADTLLVDETLRAKNLIASYDTDALEPALFRAECDEAGKAKPWVAVVDFIKRDANAPPLSPATIPDFIAETTKLKPRPLLEPGEITGLLGKLDIAQIEKEFSRIKIATLFAKARENWAAGRMNELAENIAALTPPSLKPFVSKLRETAAQRLRAELERDDDGLIVLDAWLALGPDGVIARLRL